MRDAMGGRLLEFLRDVLETRGCLAEPDPSGGLECILTPETAKDLGTPESVRFSEGPDGAGAGTIHLSLAGDAMERLGALLAERGRCAERWTGPLYLKQEGLHKKAVERLSAVNAALRFGECEEGTSSWLRATYRWTAVSEEKREGIVETVLDERTGSPCPGLLEQWDGIPWDERDALLPKQPANPLIPRLLRKAIEKKANSALEPFVASLRRRLERDARRARDYYEGIALEIRKKIGRRGLHGEEKEAEVQRIQATEAEGERKIQALVERYRLRLRLTPIAVERVIAPVMIVPLTIVRKDRSRTFILVWNPIIKDLEPPACEGCGEAAWGFSVCLEAVHLICGKCLPLTMGPEKPPCPACAQERRKVHSP